MSAAKFGPDPAMSTTEIGVRRAFDAYHVLGEQGRRAVRAGDGAQLHASTAAAMRIAQRWHTGDTEKVWEQLELAVCQWEHDPVAARGRLVAIEWHHEHRVPTFTDDIGLRSLRQAATLTAEQHHLPVGVEHPLYRRRPDRATGSVNAFDQQRDSSQEWER